MKESSKKEVSFLEFVHGIFRKRTIPEIDEYAKNHKIKRDGGG